MADSRSRATTEGIAEAWGWWLSQHDVSVPELIHDAVTKAVTAWLGYHSDDLIDAIARQHTPLPAPPDISDQPRHTSSQGAEHRMIPAPRGYVAQYREKIGDKVHYIHQPIVAFDEDGDPYVAPFGMGKRFVPAYSLDNYVGVDEDPEPPVVALLPAGGWRIEKTFDDDGTWSGPLVGWGLKADGFVVPLTTDSEGFVEQAAGDYRIYHPEGITNEKTTSPKEAP